MEVYLYNVHIVCAPFLSFLLMIHFIHPLSLPELSDQFLTHDSEVELHVPGGGVPVVHPAPVHYYMSPPGATLSDVTCTLPRPAASRPWSPARWRSPLPGPGTSLSARIQMAALLTSACQPAGACPWRHQMSVSYTMCRWRWHELTSGRSCRGACRRGPCTRARGTPGLWGRAGWCHRAAPPSRPSPPTRPGLELRQWCE